MEIFTISFKQTPAAEFFAKLKRAGIRCLLDVRLNNTSQLAAYVKRDDLAFSYGKSVPPITSMSHCLHQRRRC